MIYPADVARVLDVTGADEVRRAVPVALAYGYGRGSTWSTRCSPDELAELVDGTPAPPECLAILLQWLPRARARGRGRPWARGPHYENSVAIWRRMTWHPWPTVDRNPWVRLRLAHLAADGWGVREIAHALGKDNRWVRRTWAAQLYRPRWTLIHPMPPVPRVAS